MGTLWRRRTWRGGSWCNLLARKEENGRTDRTLERQSRFVVVRILVWRAVQQAVAADGRLRRPPLNGKALDRRMVITRIRSWIDRRSRKKTAIARAVQEFKRRTGKPSVWAYVLRIDEKSAIVGVAYDSGGRPAARTWFEVREAEIRELAFEDVAGMETPLS